MLNRPLNRMTVGSQACAVSVVVGNVRGTGSIKGLFTPYTLHECLLSLDAGVAIPAKNSKKSG